MKKVFILILLLSGLSINFTSAQVLMPMGGRIITAPTPGVSCPAGKFGSPFTMVPFGVYPPGLFVGDYYPSSLPFNLNIGSYFLGLYVPIPIPECQTQSVPPAPVTGFRTFLHGTSSFVMP